MTAPDPASVRMYQNTVDRHLRAAIRDAEWVAEHVGYLIERLKEKGYDAHGEAPQIARTAAQLAEKAAALDALHDVSFLTVELDAEADHSGGRT